MEKPNKGMPTEGTEVELTNKQQRKRAEVESAVAVKKMEQQREIQAEEYVDRRLRNTRLLIRNYRSLIDHCENAIVEAADVNSDLFYNIDKVEDIMREVFVVDDLTVESIKRSKERTMVIVAHVKEMLRLFNEHSYNSARPEDSRRADIIHWMYISNTPKTAAELACEYNITERTVYLDVDISMKRLSTLLFGIDVYQNTI